jgi:hypothetical protein
MQDDMLILQPLVVLVAWSLVMMAWMYATRIPAISRMKIPLDPNVPGAEAMNKLPPEVRWKADNYNHLMEQPTLFYALALALALLGYGDGMNLYLAWACVLSRIVHSLVQAIGNNITLRFAVFNFSSLCLLIMTVNAIRLVFM